MDGGRRGCYNENMVTTRQQALEIAAKVRVGLEKIYGPRLRACTSTAREPGIN
jgi:hypothetical protein